MFRKALILILAVFAVSGFVSTAVAEDADDEFVYGRQLMSKEELTEHRAKLRSLKTEQERETYRKEHHERMEIRAREMGVTLPEAPMKKEKGMMREDRDGMGPGMGGQRGK